MAGPLDVELVAQIEGQRDALAFQFIDDAAVVDAPHFDLAAVFAIEEPIAALLQRQNVDDRDAKFALRDQEVGQRLLVLRIDLHQDHVLRIVTGDDQLPHQLPVRIAVKSAEIDAEIGAQAVRLDILMGCGSLISVERREGLQLDQLRLQFAPGVAHQAEVHLHEHGQRSFVGNVILRRDRRVGGAAIFGIVHQLRN